MPDNQNSSDLVERLKAASNPNEWSPAAEMREVREAIGALGAAEYRLWRSYKYD